LVALYARHREDPGVQRKRRLWAELLTAALGTQFTDTDELFLEHTLLVTSAEIIAHAVVGVDLANIGPISMLSGATLSEHGITGVVEPNFSDWVIEIPGGDAFIKALARRLGRFDWAAVEHDVLKVLYESIITAQTRKRLGEYYTPDWLAEKLVADVIDAPLEQRVLDPSCGSGTFVFHAVRRYLDAATKARKTLPEAIRGVTRQVFGIDLHPVAVTLARVTYLLAIGHKRLASRDRGPIDVPVVLGDSMQWPHSLELGSRPAWLGRTDNRVDVLIGNPPWLAYRHMPERMRDQFASMSKDRGLWQGSKLATHQDLSALFVARTVQLYLRVGGRFAFVLPNSALDRRHYSGFRSGRFDDPREVVHVGFGRAWDLRRLRPHLFPRAAAVVFGRRANSSKAMPDEGEIWSGRIARGDSWAKLEAKLERTTGPLTVDDDLEASAYKTRFRQGATVVPRMLFLVERLDPGPLGMPQGQAMIRSVRTNLEKQPWRDLPGLEGPIDTEFIMPVVLGEHVLPYRTTTSAEGVIAWDHGKKQLLRPDDPRDEARLDSYKRMSKWWRRAAEVWNEHRSSDRLSFVEQLDYHGKLTAQYPIAPIRVVYAKSGMHLCAATIQHHRALIDHSLYWCRVLTLEEGHYLCAILNAACVTERVRPHMSYGKDERDIHKHVWKLPIPLFDANNRAHMKLAEHGAKVEAAVAKLELDDALHFAARRRHIREFLVEHPSARKIEAAVAKLLDR
jgi:SAM-dependent methyltransferase